MPIRLLIVDDHMVVRQGLRMFLELEPEIQIVGEAGNGARALELVRELAPDVVLMDLLMPVMDGVTATAAIRAESPRTEVVVLTSVLEDDRVVSAVRAGAIGYLLKDTEPLELVAAVRAAAAGRVHLAQGAAARLMREVRAPTGQESLTSRETDVLRLVGCGLSNREIAHSLSISEATAKTHVASLLSKLGVSSRTQAALHAIRIGLVTPGGAPGDRPGGTL
jgi:two-component system, NarL family, response regulator LiaR